MAEQAAVLVFTEHLNATWFLNFVAPAVPSDGPQLIARAASNFSDASPDAFLAGLEADIARQNVRGIILSRYVEPHVDVITQCCQRHGIPLFFHIDDYLFAVPADLGAVYLERYGAGFRAQLDAAISGCDAVLCSTPYLAGLMQARYPDKRIRALTGTCHLPYPGPRLALRSRLARLRQRLATRQNITIGYAGSSSHVRDLQLCLPAIEQLLAERPEVRFQTFGIPVPAALRERWGARVSSIGYTRDYTGYLAALYELGWDLGLAPLVDDEFNRAKTATKLIEYTACGIPALCSDVEPYRRAYGNATKGLVSPSDWYPAMQALLDDVATRRQLLAAAEQAAMAAAPGIAGRTLARALDLTNGGS
ncbi:MAG: glycosyltransferase [Moraxellaceae bacterium]|nr:glycosyltransferase [Moraxellaceae bacterium]